MTLRRFEDWPSRLALFIRARRSMPFAWGTNDCCTFTLDGVVPALTGVVLLPGAVRPTTAIGAARFLRRRGNDDVVAFATDLLGPPLPTPKLAGRGDVIAFIGDEGPTLGVCLGASVAGPGKDGLIFHSRSLAATAWRV